MQTGTSGCQYSWLTICLLLLFVFCYQHKQQQNLSFNHSSAFVTSVTTTTNKPTLMMPLMSEKYQTMDSAKTNETTIDIKPITIENETPVKTTTSNESNDRKIAVMLKVVTTIIKAEEEEEQPCLMLTYLSDKKQLDTLTISEQILNVKQRLQNQQQQTKIIPPMLLIMSVQGRNVDNNDDTKAEEARHSLSTRLTTLQQQCVDEKKTKQQQILTSSSTLFDSVTAALVHLTTWPVAVWLLLLFLPIYIAAKASLNTGHIKFVGNNYRATVQMLSNAAIVNETNDQ